MIWSKKFTNPTSISKQVTTFKTKILFPDNISNINEQLNLGFDDTDIEYYKNI